MFYPDAGAEYQQCQESYSQEVWQTQHRMELLLPPSDTNLQGISTHFKRPPNL